MIGELATDLITKLKTVTEFGSAPSRVSLTIGGKTLDPLLEKIEKPACWVIFDGDTNNSEDKNGRCLKNFSYTFIVKVVLDYTNDTDLITVQFPLLETVISKIDGTKPNLPSEKWKYVGQTIEEITDKRLVFQQSYTIVGNS